MNKCFKNYLQCRNESLQHIVRMSHHEVQRVKLLFEGADVLEDAL